MFEKDVKKTWKRLIAKDIIKAVIVYTALIVEINIIINHIFIKFIVFTVFTEILSINLKFKHIMLNEIIMYDKHDEAIIITIVINEFSKVWINQDNTVNISLKKWMFISLKLNALLKSVRVYSINSKNRELINEIFNKMHF